MLALPAVPMLDLAMIVNWQDVITAVGGQTAFLGIAAWLAKTLVSNRLAREADEFKTKLRTDSDAEIARLKNSLQMVALEHQVRFSSLHERRAEVIAELYKLLVEAPSSAARFIFTDNRDPEQAQIAKNNVLELYRFMEQNRLYFPNSVSLLLDKFVNRLRSSVNFVNLYWTQIESPSPETMRTQNEVMLAACNALETELPAVRSALEAEFRSLLGVTDPAGIPTARE